VIDRVEELAQIHRGGGARDKRRQGPGRAPPRPIAPFARSIACAGIRGLGAACAPVGTRRRTGKIPVRRSAPGSWPPRAGGFCPPPRRRKGIAGVGGRASCRQPDGPVFLLVLRDAGAFDRRSLAASALGPRQQVPEVRGEVFAIPAHGLPVHRGGGVRDKWWPVPSGEPSRRGVLADTPVGFVHPVQVRMVIERSQRPRRRRPGQAAAGPWASSCRYFCAAITIRRFLVDTLSMNSEFHAARPPTCPRYSPPPPRWFQRRLRNPASPLATRGLPRVGYPAFRRCYGDAQTASVRLYAFV
jgi:hypothetical protein